MHLRTRTLTHTLPSTRAKTTQGLSLTGIVKAAEPGRPHPASIAVAELAGLVGSGGTDAPPAPDAAAAADAVRAVAEAVKDADGATGA